jgi:hypothetical protein
MGGDDFSISALVTFLLKIQSMQRMTKIKPLNQTMKDCEHEHGNLYQ